MGSGGGPGETNGLRIQIEFDLLLLFRGRVTMDIGLTFFRVMCHGFLPKL